MNEIVFGLGCVPSTIDGSEYIFDEAKSLSLPSEYSYIEQMSPVLNQGSTNMCVTYATGAHLDWNINMDFGTKNKDNHINRNQIYSARSLSGDRGMTYKEAFKYIRNNGVDTDKGKSTIEYYAKINSEIALKQALLLNGPCVGGLRCYNDGPTFWKENRGDDYMGGHAISIVGYNKEGFILRNSWGPNWATRGYTLLPYKEFQNMFEIWTIID